MKITNNEEPLHNEISIDYEKCYVKRENTNKIISHPFCEVIVLNKGDVVYTAGGRMVHLGDKSVIYNPAGMIHNNFVQQSHIYERYRIRFYGEELSAMLSDTIATPFTKKLRDEDFTLIFDLAKSIYTSTDKQLSSDILEMRVQHALELIIMNSVYANDREDTESESYVFDVIEYINAHICEKLTIDSIASDFFVSRGKLIYDFTSYCNLSINEYITMARIQKAKSLLIGGYTVSSVAQECGFSSSSYFIKVFSSIEGVTPLKYQTKKR